MTRPDGPGGAYAAGLAAVLPVAIAAGLGNLATMPNLAPWYARLVKPALNPPNWIFGPVWTTLYALMAYAAFRVLRAPPSAPRRRALWAFYIQLALNASWSFAFFAAHQPALGLVVIVTLLATILATIAWFGRVDQIASRLLWPYAAWVAFASYLNAAICALN